MKNLDSETIDFTSIFKGYRIPIPFFLLCIDKYFLRFRHKKHTNKLIYLLVFLMFNLFAIEK